MKERYLLRIEYENNEVAAFNFCCTRSQIDKLFFAFALACPMSNVSRGDLYLEHDCKTDIMICQELLNSFKRE